MHLEKHGVRTMTIAQPSRLATGGRSLFLCLAVGLAVAALGGADRTEAASVTARAFTAHTGIVLVQNGPESDKKAKSSEKSKRTKRRAIRCGGPGLPDCTM